MRKEAARWFEQAQEDLKAARDSLEMGHFNWSCFQSQQSGEKALKAYLYDRGYTSIVTHSVRILLQKCVELKGGFSECEEAARALDMYYIPTRYPNGLDGDVIPSRYFDRKDAEKCVRYATLILKAVRRSMPG